MREREILVFSDKEEECVDLLTQTGMKRSNAIVLVYLANVRTATSRDIERGTMLRQSQVSLAIKYLTGRHWIDNYDVFRPMRGRPTRNYSLALPFKEIITAMGKEKRMQMNHHLGAIGKLSEEFCTGSG